jgi:hypothetical protein
LYQYLAQQPFNSVDPMGLAGNKQCIVPMGNGDKCDGDGQPIDCLTQFPDDRLKCLDCCLDNKPGDLSCIGACATIQVPIDPSKPCPAIEAYSVCLAFVEPSGVLTCEQCCKAVESQNDNIIECMRVREVLACYDKDGDGQMDIPIPPGAPECAQAVNNDPKWQQMKDENKTDAVGCKEDCNNYKDPGDIYNPPIWPWPIYIVPPPYNEPIAGVLHIFPH